MPQNEEGSKMEWICAWVPYADYLKERKKEKERETSRKVPHNNNIKNKLKNGMYA